MCRLATHSDFISMYRFFIPKTLQNIDFFMEDLKGVPYSFFIYADFVIKSKIFLVIYAWFVSDHISRSKFYLCIAERGAW